MSDDKYWYGLFEISIRHSKIKHLNTIETINVNNLKVIIKYVLNNSHKNYYLLVYLNKL